MIAVLFTCFNRKEKTVRCIQSLLNQKNMPPFELYVCDDGSTDGTAEAITELIPKAHILKGTGNLFWSRGMHVAMKAAVEKGYDYYLMINDDVEFLDTMWETMYSAIQDHPEAGISGCTLAKSTGKQSYGGANFCTNKKGDYIGPMLTPNEDAYVYCDLANWNCFLINRNVIDTVGVIDNRYEHAMGDYDYSFRMRRAGYQLVLAKKYVGYCENNGIKGTFKDGNIPRKARLKKLFAPNGLPIRSWYRFVTTYYGKGKFKNFVGPYVKYLIYILAGKGCR